MSVWTDSLLLFREDVGMVSVAKNHDVGQEAHLLERPQ